MARAKKIAKPELPMPPPPRRIDSKVLREARKAAGLTQIHLCILTGVSIRTISRLESGTHQGSPSLTDVGRIADLLGISLETLAPKPKG